MPNNRLTLAAARPGMRVICVDAAGASGLGLWEGRTYTIKAVASGRVLLVDSDRFFYPDRFVPADDLPTLAALLAERAPEFLAAVREWQEWMRDRREKGGGKSLSDCRLFEAISRAGLIAPSQPFHLTPQQFQEMWNAG